MHNRPATDGDDVFISHAGSRTAEAQRLRTLLQDAGFTAFEDTLLPPGVDWETGVLPRLVGATAFVVLISSDLRERRHVGDEIQRALALRHLDASRHVVPVYLERVSLIDLDLGLGKLTAIDASAGDNLEDVAQQLAHALCDEDGNRRVPGPREAGGIDARVLRAFDDVALERRGNAIAGEFIRFVEDAVRVACRVGADPDTDEAALITVLRERGLDPRVLVPSHPDHVDAVRRWVTPQSETGLGVAARHDALERLRIAISARIESFGPLILTRATRRRLARRLSSEPPDVTRTELELYLAGMSAMLPALRPVTREAVRLESTDVRPTARSARGLSLRSIARMLCLLPPPDRPIVGIGPRADDLASHLVDRVASSDRAVAWISGPPGGGASTLAIETARRAAGSFGGGALYIDVNGLDSAMRRSVTQVVELVSAALDIDRGPPVHSEAEALARFRADLEGRAVLLILDNAADADHIGPLLTESASCAVVVSTRSRVQAHAAGAINVPLDGLERADSVALITALVARSADDPAATHRIAELCDDLPLALRLAAAWMDARRDLAPDDVVALLEDAARRLDYLAVGERAVRAAIALSYQQLDLETRALLRHAARAPGSTVTATFLGACLNEVPSRIELLLNRLVDRRLASSQPLRASDGRPLTRFRLHGLVRLFAAERGDEEDAGSVVDDFQRRAVEVLSTELAALLNEEPVTDVTLEFDRSAARTAFRWAIDAGWIQLGVELGTSLDALIGAGSDVEAMAEISTELVSLHLRSDHPDRAVATHLRHAETMQRLSHGDRARRAAQAARALARERGLPADQAAAAFRLASIEAEAQDLVAALDASDEAARLYEAASQMLRATTAARNSARISSELGDTAAPAERAATVERLAPYVADRAVQASALFDAAWAFAEAGQHVDAVRLYQRAADAYTQLDDRSNAATAAYNGATSARMLGDAAREAGLLREAAASYAAAWRREWHVTALINLSAAHVRQGDPAAADATITTALEVTHADRVLLAPRLRYEVGVRAAVIRWLASGEQPLGEEHLRGPARRHLPVRAEEDRIDPLFEGELELLYELPDLIRAPEEVRGHLAELAGLWTRNRPEEAYELRLSGDPGPDPASARAIGTS